MRKICKYCNQQYDGDPGSSACPECAEKVKRKTVLTRICRKCGKAFPGGPRAWYCPDCRDLRRRNQSAEHKRRGTIRPLGSIDKCVVCGRDYIVNSARQRYCPTCAPEAVREVDRIQSKAWNKEHTTPAQRRDVRHNASAQIPCRICGKLFRPTSSAETCSPVCSARLAKDNAAAWEKANREYRNQYQRQRLNERIESMTPDEYRQYREKVNQRSQENYQKRKEKSNKNDT